MGSVDRTKRDRHVGARDSLNPPLKLIERNTVTGLRRLLSEESTLVFCETIDSEFLETKPLEPIPQTNRTESTRESHSFTGNSWRTTYTGKSTQVIQVIEVKTVKTRGALVTGR